MNKSLFRTLGINAMVLVVLILALDFASISVFELRNLLRRDGVGPDEMVLQMAEKPAFEGSPWIDRHVRDVLEEQSAYVSFIGWRRKPMKTATINIDSNGVRRTHRHPSADARARKVAFLGGSTMWGTGSPDSLTIPSMFNLFGKGRYDAVNFGESSYNAYQGYQFLLLRLIHGYRPDIIVSYDGVNNSPTICPRPFAHARENQIAELLRGADRPVREDFSFKGHYLRPTGELLRRFAVRSGLMGRDTLPGETAGMSSQPMTDEDAARYLLDSWNATLDVAQRIGARFLCVLQPNVRVGQPDLSHMTEEEKGRFSFTYYKEVFRLMETERYQRLKPYFLDARHAFDGVPKLYFDFCHVAPRGNGIIAEAIKDRLESEERAEDFFGGSGAGRR